MATRRRGASSLSDEEVGVIKNLLAKDTFQTQQEILAVINAKRRECGYGAVNNGRITEIKHGTHGYNDIPVASDDIVEAYLLRADDPPSVDDPLSEATLRRLFDDSGEGKLVITETDEVEFKETFTNNGPSNHAKTIAAFANNRGGYLVFGVQDGDRKVVGINEKAFNEFDLKKLNEYLYDCLQPAIRVGRKIWIAAGKPIGIFYIYSAETKPVLCTKTKDKMTQGTIYYRYSGESRPIAPSDLQKIIEERIRDLATLTLSKYIATISKYIATILKNGIENSAIVNLETGIIDGKSESVVIDESLISKIDFIKEGEFKEVSGSPALKIVGEVQPIGVVQGRAEDILLLYPFTWRDLVKEVKKQVDDVKLHMINSVIKDYSLKGQKEYTHISHRSLKQKEDYEKSGEIPNGATWNYNQKAVDFVIEKVEALCE